MKKLVLFLVLSIPLFLLGCAEEEEKPTCSVTADDFTYERLDFYKYQLKLKDPNKEVKGNYYWEYEDKDYINENIFELEPTLEYKRPYVREATLHMNGANLQCGTIKLPVFKNSQCEQLDLALRNMSVPLSYRSVSFSLQYLGDYSYYHHESGSDYQGLLALGDNAKVENVDNITLDAKFDLYFKNGENFQPINQDITPDKRLKLAFQVDTKKLENVVFQINGKYLLSAELHTTFKDNTKCINDIWFMLPRDYKP